MFPKVILKMVFFLSIAKLHIQIIYSNFVAIHVYVHYLKYTEWYKSCTYLLEFIVTKKKTTHQIIEALALYYWRISQTSYYVHENRFILTTHYDLFWILTFSIFLLQKLVKMCQKIQHFTGRKKTKPELNI